MSTDSGPPSAGKPEQNEYTAQAARHSLMARRRERIAAEIDRNRRGEYTVPTWVLTAALVLLVAGIAALVIFS